MQNSSEADMWWDPRRLKPESKSDNDSGDIALMEIP